MESSVHSSLHPNCHHQVVFPKSNLKNCYPPPYEREIWHLKRRMLTLFLDESTNSVGITDFLTDANQKAHLFSQTIENIICNFIPHDL